MKIDELIVELIQEHKNVIVPGLGSFIKSEGSGSFTVLFNEYLKYNDGLLQNKVQQQASCTKEEAMELITSYSNAVLSQIEVDGSYLIVDLGVILLKSGKITFEYTGAEKAHSTTKEIEEANAAAATPPSEDEIEATILNDIKDANDQGVDPLVTEESLSAGDQRVGDDISEADIDEEEDEVPDPSDLELEELSSITQMSATAEEEEEEEEEEETAGFTSETSERTSPTPPANKPRKGKGMLWLGTGFLISGLSLLFWLQRDKLSEILGIDNKNLAMESTLDSTKEENKNVLMEVEDSSTNMETDQSLTVNITEDTTHENMDTIKQIEEIIDTVESNFPKEEIEPSYTEPEEIENTVSAKKYHIIGGSFSSEKNASQFVTTLKESGYDKALIIGQRNELYTVSFGGYESKDDAKEQADRIISDGKFQGAWVLYY